ncbi:hypothetical protein CC2G_006119 [Coprinopsis cinerea AmutBmut pab1-1]|nr:hypothetical protein CC2G_006119 [Coprinopsis cinerea AmutBmut pab1-1]
MGLQNVPLTGDALQQRRIERACFNGLLLSSLAYGALLMIVMQLTQVLIMRPKRGRLFWWMVLYTAFIFLLSTFAIGGRFKFAEMMYVDHQDFEEGYLAYYFKFMDRWQNVLNMACLTLLPWISDSLMIYRLYILWNYQWWALGVPLLVHLARIAISIPILIITANADDPNWLSQFSTFKTAYYSVSMAIDLLFTGLISFRLWMLRDKVEHVLGKIQSVYYNSTSTKFVESGALFTLWSVGHLILLVKEHWASEILGQPMIYLNAITRMLIILRMAQNRAWCRDIVTASATGVLEWQVSSHHSIPLNQRSSQLESQTEFEKLPKQMRGDAAGL